MPFGPGTYGKGGEERLRRAIAALTGGQDVDDADPRPPAGQPAAGRAATTVPSRRPAALSDWTPPAAGDEEDEAKRLRRIAREFLSGERSLDELRQART